MKHALLALFAMLILGGCTWIVDPRSPEVAAATRTAIAEGIPPLPAVTPEAVATAELVPTVTPCRTVAGNINAQGKKLYHTAESPNFGQVVIDESKGERWFCDTASAEAAGWVKGWGN